MTERERNMKIIGGLLHIPRACALTGNPPGQASQANF